MKEGSICIVIAGRDAGKKVEIVGKEEGFFIVVGKNVKRRRINRKHLIEVGKK